MQALATTAYRTAHKDSVANPDSPLLLRQLPALEKMLREMLTVGVPMSVVITLVWIGWALVKSRRVPSLHSE